MDKANRIVLSTDNIYLKCMEIYKIVKNDEVLPEVKKFSWRNFKYVTIKQAEPQYQIKVVYSAYNVSTNGIETLTQKYNFDDKIKRDSQFTKFVEQAKIQDPSAKYAEDALMEALK